MASTSELRRPTKGTLTERVWAIADQISHRTERKATWQEVVDAYAREGGNQNTASTQFYLWSKTYSSPPRSQGSLGASSESVVVQMGRDGRVLVPQAFRAAMGIDDSTRLAARIENGELRIIPQKLAFQRLQALVRQQDKGQGSVADELLAERRQEANRQ